MTKDFLWPNISSLPYFRGVLRAVEARFYQDYDLPQPVLDMGCGDGFFAALTFDHQLDIGIDPWTGPLRHASKTSAYRHVIQGFADNMPFEDCYFNSVISNSVLEHIVDLDASLLEIGRVMKPGGIFLFCVPNHTFLSRLSISSFFDLIGLKSLGDVYRKFFNHISRHHHCDSPEVWNKRLEQAGFKVERCWHYFSPQSLHILEWGHYLGFPSMITHLLFGRWILIPQRWNLALTQAIVQPVYDEQPEQVGGAYTFYVTRRV